MYVYLATFTTAHANGKWVGMWCCRLACAQFILYLCLPACQCQGLFPDILPRDRWELASMLVQLVDGNCLEAPSLDLEAGAGPLDGCMSSPVCLYLLTQSGQHVETHCRVSISTADEGSTRRNVPRFLCWRWSLSATCHHRRNRSSLSLVPGVQAKP
jgi:hypothetical protein